MRDVLVRLGWRRVRPALVNLIRAAHRRKALTADGLPFGVLAMDGKVTPLKASAAGTYAQAQETCSLVRTITGCLVSNAARVCIDMYPIPATTNEMGVFQKALQAILRTYKGIELFRLVSYDSGACSRENA